MPKECSPALLAQSHTRFTTPNEMARPSANALVPWIRLADLFGWGERRGLSFVGLLATGADEIFHSLRRLGALSLLEFTDPVGDSIHHVVRCFADNFGFAFLPVHALSAFDDFYFLLRHKL